MRARAAVTRANPIDAAYTNTSTNKTVVHFASCRCEWPYAYVDREAHPDEVKRITQDFKHDARVGRKNGHVYFEATYNRQGGDMASNFTPYGVTGGRVIVKIVLNGGKDGGEEAEKQEEIECTKVRRSRSVFTAYPVYVRLYLSEGATTANSDSFGITSDVVTQYHAPRFSRWVPRGVCRANDYPVSAWHWHHELNVEHRDCDVFEWCDHLVDNSI